MQNNTNVESDDTSNNQIDANDERPPAQNASEEDRIDDSVERRPQRSEEAKKRKFYFPSFKGKTYAYAQLLQCVKKEEKIKVDKMHRKAVNIIFAKAEDKLNDVKSVPGGTYRPQISAKQGIKTHGERTVAAIIKEYL